MEKMKKERAHRANIIVDKELWEEAGRQFSVLGISRSAFITDALKGAIGASQSKEFQEVMGEQLINLGKMMLKKSK